MPNAIPLTLMLLGAAHAAAATLPKGLDPDPIAGLNECIQRRFLGTGAFGMGRVLPNRYHGVAQFQPEDATEQRVVTELAQKGYQVTVFLAGQHVLDTAPVGMQVGRFGLQGPAYVAGTNSATALPDRELLLAEGRKAMQSLAARDDHSAGYEVNTGNWTVAVRPLRASSERCVMCHTVGFGTLVRDSGRQPKLGDALGVAMYVYRH
jgi:hypothetical protein